ncbi:hypothetical protein AB0P05_33150 [Streptomyces flaveolus]|uniref:ATP-dependent DNA ligase n=1 Tax=Streptomyces flaveolus TaxID=67297 RepID=UPI00341C6063
MCLTRGTRRPARQTKPATHRFAHKPVGETANPRASAFDLVHQGDTDLTGWPYERRRAALEALFADHRLEALTLCPSTTDPDVARRWLEWTAAGLEGLCFKLLDEPSRPTRSWLKYKVPVTTEAVVGAATGSLAAPRTVLLGR